MPLKLNDETLNKENENETEVKMTKEQEELNNNDTPEADKYETKEDISSLFEQPESGYNAELTEEAREGFENKRNEYNKITSIEEYKQNVVSRLENAKTHEELLNLATEIYYDYNNPENEQYKEKLKIYFQHVNKKGL